MKTPFIKTVVMALIAVVASGVAASYYPWPETVVESDVVGEPLFELYDTTSVRCIRITEFNEDRNGLDRIVLRRSGEKWIIPDRKNFVATNAFQISLAANSLSEVIVEEEITDEQQAYLEYGVVDPDEYQNTPNRSALGRKIILEDRNGKSLASLIVGQAIKDEKNKLKHLVRIPGQPSVYQIEFNPDALSTDFRSWVNSNLFQLRNEELIEDISIENYQMDPKVGPASQKLNYRASFNVANKEIALKSVETGTKDGKWAKVGLTKKMNQPIHSAFLQLINIQFTDVRRKNEQLTKLLSAPNSDDDASLLAALEPLGFYKTGFKDSNYEFESAGGKISVTTKDGVVLTLNIGDIAEKNNANDLELGYHAMISASVDESIVPEPKKPAANEDADIAEKQEKAYLRLVEQRNLAIKSAHVRASEFNQRHAEWVYIVSESVIDTIRPDLEIGSGDPRNPNTKIGEALLRPAEPEKESSQQTAPKK